MKAPFLFLLFSFTVLAGISTAGFAENSVVMQDGNGGVLGAVVSKSAKDSITGEEAETAFRDGSGILTKQYEKVNRQLQVSRSLRRIIMILGGITLVLFVYSFRKYRSYRALNKELTDKQQQLSEAYREIKSSQKKYHYQYERMRQLLEVIADGTWELNLETKEIFLGDGMEKMIGYKPDIKNIQNLEKDSHPIHPQDYGVLAEAIKKCATGECKDLSLDLRVLDHRQNYRWLQLRGCVIKPLYTTEERKIFGIVYDMQALKRAKADTQKKEKELQEANKAKDKFFSIIAHDLKSPFNAILGLSELLVKEYESFDEEEIREFAENIYIASDSAYQLLQNLLQWSRSQNNRIEFHPVRHYLTTIAAEVVKVNQHRAEHKKITLYTEIPEELQVIADRNMLYTILHNLLSNAIKFTPANRSVKITAAQLRDATEIHVIDEGMGISEEHTHSLFNIDNTYRRPGTDHEKSTGLGLILCKEFVDKHNGQIWVDSKLGEGSDFGFTLPHQVRRG